MVTNWSNALLLPGSEDSPQTKHIVLHCPSNSKTSSNCLTTPLNTVCRAFSVRQIYNIEDDKLEGEITLRVSVITEQSRRLSTFYHTYECRNQGRVYFYSMVGGSGDIFTADYWKIDSPIFCEFKSVFRLKIGWNFANCPSIFENSSPLKFFFEKIQNYSRELPNGSVDPKFYTEKL